MEIQHKIQEQFSKYPHLRVLFFFDTDRTYFSEIEAMELKGIRVIVSDGRHFRIKYRLEYDYPNEKVLLYLPEPKPDQISNFVLLDILTANKELRLNDIDSFMDEYKLKAMHRSLVKKYVNELILKKYSQILSPYLNAPNFTKENIERAFASATLDFKMAADNHSLLIKLFILHQTESTEKFNKRLKNIRALAAEQMLLNFIKQCFTTPNADQLTDSLITELAGRLKYNLITHKIKEAHAADNYAIYKETSDDKINQQLAIWLNWQNNNTLKKFATGVLRHTANAINEIKLIAHYGVLANFWLYTSEMIQHIAASILPDISQKNKNATQVFQKIADSDNLQVELRQFLGNAIEFYSKYNKVSGFTFDKIENYYSQYTQQFYLFDFYFRKIIIAFRQLKQKSNIEISAYEQFIEKLEKDYQQILIELNNEWVKIVEENQHHIYPETVLKQTDFYSKKIANIEHKKVVIISDALRYEAGFELNNRIIADHNFATELDFAITQIPSNTQLGMSALLPHKQMEWNNGQIKIEQISTSGIQNRRKILQTFNPNAEAIKYADLEALSEREAREMFKKNLVYIYHDVIDATGDNRKTEHQTFEAVEKAITELSNLTKRIHSTMGVSYIYITSDHGFVYQPNQLTENMFTPVSENTTESEISGRYILHNEHTSESGLYSFPFSKTTAFNNNLFISVPKGINRFRKQGVSHNFFHGGIALQEIITPILLSRKQIKNEKQKTKILLVNKNARIVSNALKIILQQVNPVNENYAPITLVCCLYNIHNQPVATEIEITMSHSSLLPTERTENRILILNANAGNENFYYFRAYDKDEPERLNPIIDHKVDNNSAMAVDEFL